MSSEMTTTINSTKAPGPGPQHAGSGVVDFRHRLRGGYINDPVRFHQSYIICVRDVAAAGLGAFFFVMVQYLTVGVERYHAQNYGEHHGHPSGVRHSVSPHRVRAEGYLSLDG